MGGSLGALGTIGGGAAGFMLGGPAGAMAGAAAGGALGGAAGSLIGGNKKTTTQQQNVGEASAQEKELLNSLMSGSKIDPSNEALTNQAFKKMLANYLATTNGAPTPEMLEQATAYVDATYTNPAQVSFDKFQRQYMANANEQAAALGRQPMDSSIQQQNFRTLADINAQMGAERGSRISQRVVDAPQQQLSFINDLNQSAFNNRIGLLNLQSGLYNNMAARRYGSAGTSTTTPGADTGLLGQAAGIGQAISGLGDIYKKFGGSIGGSKSSPGGIMSNLKTTSGSAGLSPQFSGSLFT